MDTMLLTEIFDKKQVLMCFLLHAGAIQAYTVFVDFIQIEIKHMHITYSLSLLRSECCSRFGCWLTEEKTSVDY
jgi:hypothetical protein